MPDQRNIMKTQWPGRSGPSGIGADERSRTSDLLITNQLLYQLSYISAALHFNKKLKPLLTAIGWAAGKTLLDAG
jgi:hypothetical protein